MADTDQITNIEVVFSSGSFEEWTEAAGDSYPQAFICEWQTNYNNLLRGKLAEVFPNAKIEVGEGYDQTMDTGIFVEGSFKDETGKDEDEIKEVIRNLLYIANDCDLMDEVWNFPSIATISQTIEDLTEEKPIGHIDYVGADYVFAQHDGAIRWLDLDVEEILDPEAEWQSGTSEDAAIAFRSEFDPDFKLIAQAEAVSLGAPSVQAVNNAIRDGRLKGYNNRQAQHQRQGKTLVSKQEIIKLWG